mmetsp:Transcript_20179/g.45594  ORF Transcript_20179/g.45594 Transcript_20179/m.45594 type:complete len:83 (-) Transcript_20179:312-560(-)
MRYVHYLFKECFPKIFIQGMEAPSPVMDNHNITLPQIMMQKFQNFILNNLGVLAEKKLWMAVQLEWWHRGSNFQDRTDSISM